MSYFQAGGWIRGGFDATRLLLTILKILLVFLYLAIIISVAFGAVGYFVLELNVPMIFAIIGGIFTVFGILCAVFLGFWLFFFILAKSRLLWAFLIVGPIALLIYLVLEFVVPTLNL